MFRILRCSENNYDIEWISIRLDKRYEMVDVSFVLECGGEGFTKRARFIRVVWGWLMFIIVIEFTEFIIVFGIVVIELEGISDGLLVVLVVGLGLVLGVGLMS